MADSQGPTVSGVALAFAVLTFIVLSLRLFSRVYVLRKMGPDDCEYSTLRLEGQSTDKIQISSSVLV